MTTTLQRLDVVQVFTDIDGTGKTWNDYCTIKEQGDEDRAVNMVTQDPQRYRVFGRRIVDGVPVYACVFGQAEVSAEAMRKQKEHAAKISELLSQFDYLARAKGLDLGEVIEQYNEENLPDGTEDGEYHYFRGIDMSNLP